MSSKLEKTLTLTEWIGIFLIVVIVLPGAWRWIRDTIVAPQVEAIQQIEQLQQEVQSLERIIKE